jgi:hypothetical protein
VAELIAGDIDQRETPTLLRKSLKISLDEYLDGLLTRVDLHTDGRITKIHLVSATILSPDDGVGHAFLLALRSKWMAATSPEFDDVFWIA